MTLGKDFTGPSGMFADSIMGGFIELCPENNLYCYAYSCFISGRLHDSGPDSF